MTGESAFSYHGCSSNREVGPCRPYFGPKYRILIKDGEWIKMGDFHALYDLTDHHRHKVREDYAKRQGLSYWNVRVVRVQG